VLALPTFAQDVPRAISATPEPAAKVEIINEPDSPVRLSNINTKLIPGNNSTALEFYSVVKNAGDKAVSVYAVRFERAPAADGGCLTIVEKSLGKALRPGKTEGHSTWRGYQALDTWRVSVDFVEFTDGTTWGKDSCKSAEMLVATRAGARAARKLLTDVFTRDGADAVIKLIQSDFDIDVPSGEPWQWQEGYRGGFKGYLERIKSAVQEWGYTEIEYALKRPIDALEEKKL
jgi:hypothetical protein